MALAGKTGLELKLIDLPRSVDLNRADFALFSESLGRFIVEVRPEDTAAFEKTMADLPCAAMGRVRADEIVQIDGFDGRPLIQTDISAIDHAWRGHLKH
jgi:phosphoribosylformylglycinamidine synthase